MNGGWGDNSGMERHDPSHVPGHQRGAGRGRAEGDATFQNSQICVFSVPIGGRDSVPPRDMGSRWANGGEQGTLPLLDPSLHSAVQIGHS